MSAHKTTKYGPYAGGERLPRPNVDPATGMAYGRLNQVGAGVRALDVATAGYRMPKEEIIAERGYGQYQTDGLTHPGVPPRLTSQLDADGANLRAMADTAGTTIEAIHAASPQAYGPDMYNNALAGGGQDRV